ncbi:MAG: ComF family protein [Proteobacteria bacterium]|nr:ComF family protein [Desulfobacula sp.]MBU3954183.1 ComF family protein [Pseudomonadota bacterium]MBU4130046.1 ComF family protein [Pseudomonadota bacterium]
MFTVFKDYCRADSFWTIKRLLFAFQTLVFPFHCLKCKTYIDPDRSELWTLSACFCPKCLPSDPPLFTSPFCLVCGRLFESPMDGDFVENHPCETCLVNPSSVSRVRAAFQYQGIVKEAVALFKYQSKLCLARVLETYLFDAFDRFFATAAIDYILPIPLHPQKMRRRGFNQSFLLVRNFKKNYESVYKNKPCWRIDTNTLARVKKTLPQTGFDIHQRKDNLKGAFLLAKKANVTGKNILLVDDVYTTGATCNEAARVLLKSGAARVDALVLARA